MGPDEMPVARELFDQWRRARGDRPAPASRPFSRGWEDLLADAGLASAADRNDADRDAQHLERGGWVQLKTVRYRAHLIDRIVIPLEAEARWREAFGFVPLSDSEMAEIRAFSWEPELAFVSGARLNLAFSELRQLNEFFANGGRARETVPIKERSLEIFGDEKRLDVLLGGSALFGDGRLTPERLRFVVVAEPLGWKRGTLPAGPAIVLENLATWESYGRWDRQTPQFSAVIYGGGNRFAESVGFLADVFREIGGSRRVLYFGDLDSAGLRIPQRAAVISLRLGLPPVEPHLPSYRWLLERGRDKSMPWEVGEPARREMCAWLGELASPAWDILSRGHRLAQEHVGWTFLSEMSSDLDCSHHQTGDLRPA